ncbi:MAG: hypothetical protein ACREGG_04285 [Candidatus Saccharimonadales bacterium]
MQDDQNNVVDPRTSSAASESLEGPSEPELSSSNTSPASPTPPSKPGLLKRLHLRNNLYFVIFILLVLTTVAVIFVTYRNNKNSTKTSNVGSLTSQQLAALNGNTTLVGDSKQTLDVQSNSIFEGQVLVRSDLNVAGAIKVGGGLSLNSITVGGSGNFGSLNVSGDTSLQGQLTVQKNLNVGGSANFGSLAVSQLSVTNLLFQGNLTLSKHIIVSGSTPGRTNGTALGAGGTSSVSGTDTAGTVTINTGSSPPAGCFITVNFTQKFNFTPHVIISPSNSPAAGLQYYTNRSTTSFSVCTANPPTAALTYLFDYAVFD